MPCPSAHLPSPSAADQATALRQAGLTAYNHNLDTSPEFYGKISTTRSYSDRLQTLAHVREAVRAGRPPAARPPARCRNTHDSPTPVT